MEFQTQIKASLSPSTPVQNGLLQRKSASGCLAGECTERSKKSLMHQRRSINDDELSEIHPIAHEVLRSHKQPLDAVTHAFKRFGHDFSKIQVRSTRPETIQTKLIINKPGDLYEQEADSVAEKVMRMPAPAIQRQAVPEEEEEDDTLQMKPLAAQITPLVQREKTPEEEDEGEEIALQRQALTKEEDEEEEELLQTKRADAQVPAVTSSVEAAVQSIRQSGGRPLDPATRAFMEPRFGHNFGNVRVHTESRAARAAGAVDAQAFTIGNNVVFGLGQYAPETAAGRRLLAHELTHVVHQTTPGEYRIGRSDAKSGLFPIPSVIHQGGASSPIGFSISRASEYSVQRDEESKTLKTGLGEAAQKAAGKAREEAKKATLAELKEIESNWKEMRDPATGFSEVTDWLAKGDTVIGLLRTHTELALDAIDKGDSALTKFMTSIVESDMVMYRFIVWHVAVFVNLLTLEPQMKDLADAFAADRRAFTGRADAEEGVKLLIKLAATYRKKAPEWLKLVKILPAEVTRSSGEKITLTVTIAAHHDKSISQLFSKETEAFIKDQSAIETLVIATNQFLDTAFKEGLVQAAESVVEFYLVRGGRRGGPKATKRKATKRKGKGKQKKKKKKKSKKCSDALIAKLNAAMHIFCDQPRRCSIQGDTCTSATAKVAAGYGCVDARTKLQQKCFSPGEPDYENHMEQIAQANAALRKCITVMTAKCR